MQVVIDENEFTRNRPFRVEIDFDDEKVAEFLKCARVTAKDEIINSTDVISWIPSAVKGSIYLSFPGTDRFYYIHPSGGKIDINSVINDARLSNEILAEICLKTAKCLTVLHQADLKMREDPPSIEEFVKDYFKKNSDTLATVTEFLRKLVDCTNVVAENLLEYLRTASPKELDKVIPRKEEIPVKADNYKTTESKESILMNRNAIKYFAAALNGDVDWDILTGETSCTVKYIKGGVMLRSDFLAKENGLYELISNNMTY